MTPLSSVNSPATTAAVKTVFHFPASYAQQRLWFLNQITPGSGVYNIPSAVRIEGPLNVAALHQGLQEIARRHETLRTTFAVVKGELQQMIAEEIPLELPVEDLRLSPSTPWEPQVQIHLQKEVWAPFDLAHGPLIRLKLLRLDEQDHVLSITVHHVVYDGWSIGILIRELSVLYKAFCEGKPSPLPDLSIQYVDYTDWQRQWLSGKVLEQQIHYWKQQLAGVEPLELPTDRPRPPVTTYRGGVEKVSMSREVTEQLRKLSQRHDATMYMALLAALQMLLARYSGQQDISVGCPVAGRPRPEMEALIGVFLNTLVLRTQVTGSLSFTEFLKQVKETTLQAYAHQDVPFEQLVEALQPERDLSRTPLFQVMFVFQNVPSSELRLGTARLTPFILTNTNAKFDLTFTLVDTEFGVQGTLGYSTDLFEVATMQRLVSHFESLLGSIVAAPEQQLSDLSLLTAEEKQLLLVDWNQTAVPLPFSEGTYLLDLIEEQVAQKPQAEAAANGTQSLTYRELNHQANQLARYLKKVGVGPEVRVGICVGRSLKMIVGLLGVMKAGGVYVPLDPEYPPERVRYMLEDSQASILLTEKKLLSQLPPFAGRVISLDEQWPEIERENGENLKRVTFGDNLAYLIYTSGSTGRPKGVAIRHSSAVLLVAWTRNIYSDEELGGVLASTSICFDVSIFEIFVTLSCGGRMLLVGNALDLAGIANPDQVKVVTSVPSAMRELARIRAIPDSVRTIGLGGEAVPAGLAPEIYEASKAERILNLYGPSEDTTYTTCALLPRTEELLRVAVGRPVPFTQLYILDAALNPVPLGVPGELYIGGAGLARGYWNHPELTAERFVPNPLAQQSGERLYRTGDLVRYRADGNLEFLRRLDHQIKIRGHRIELGEIEAILEELPNVRQAVVLAREDDPGEKSLVAYVVAKPEATISADELQLLLKQRIPDYMVPGAFVLLDEMPLTPNGKINRKALPAPAKSRAGAQAAYVAASTAEEEALAQIWCSVLRLDRVGVHDNFFDVGGHSLLATQLLARIRDVFNIEIPLLQVFEHPTIAGLAAIISNPSSENSLPQLISVPSAASTKPQDQFDNNGAEPASESFSYPASFAQRRLWLIDQYEPGLSTYNVTFALRIQGPVDAGILKKSFQEIVNRHESLRTTFMAEGGEPQQVIHAQFEVKLPVFDLSAVPPEQREAKARRRIEEEGGVPFDLVRGPLLRLELLRLDEQDHLLRMDIHHIVTDGWSVGVLTRELSALYSAFSAGKPSPLPDLPIQYVDYTAWQREWLQGEVLEQQIGYWKKQLAGVVPLELPSDRPRPPVMAYRGDTRPVTISVNLVDKLKELARQQGATLYMTVMAAFHALLYRYSGQQDITVGSPIAGRRRQEMELLIGFFVNTLVLRSDVSGDMDFMQLLKQIRETTLEAYANQDAPFERLVEILQPERDLARTPVFQVMFVLQNAPSSVLEFGSARLSQFPYTAGTAKFDLTLILSEVSSELQGSLGYSSGLFDPDTIDRMIQHFQKLLGGIVAAPHRHLGEFSLLTRDEEKQVIEDWNLTGKTFRQEYWVHEMFAAHAAKAPNDIAVTYESEQLTYGEMDQRSNQLANYLIAQGVHPDDRVGLCIKRSLRMVIGLMGIVKAGAAYTPLDPAYPQARLQYMLENSAMRMLLTESEFSGLFHGDSTKQLVIEEAWPAILQCSAEAPRPQLDAENLAYVIYTSGSTGKPKGVALSHRVLSNLIQWQTESFVFVLKNTLQFSALSFDVSVQEIFSTFATGGVLHLIDDDKRRDIMQLRHIISQRQIERIFLPFVALDYLSKAYLEEDAPECPLREVLCGGEQLQITSAIMQLYQRARNAVLVNHYGPSETHLSHTYTLSGDSGKWPKLPPIGRAVTNAQLYVLNQWMEPAPIGVPGELFISGAQVARGYLNRPDLTAERFLPNPFSHTAGDRMYKTGDIARWRKDGEMEFLGRADGQVKIRGYRIELGEIETVLRQHPVVEQAVVIVREDEQKQKRLIAYVVLRQQIATSELRDELQGRLPEFMVPSVFMVLEKIPLTPSGKIDRRSLPAPPTDRAAFEQAVVAPRTPTEELLTQIWSAVLGRAQISVEDDFFAIGGHSLLATQVTARIRNIFKVEVPLRRMFESPTIGKLAKVLDQLTASAPEQLSQPLRRVTTEETFSVPLSYAQQRLWFVDQLTPGNTVYNMPVFVRVAGPLKVQALQLALKEIIHRHESLRTRFAIVDGEPRQIISAAADLDLPLLDLSSSPAEQREAEARKIAVAEAQSPFDLERGPLFRVKLVKLADDDHVLATNMHHIISDGWSIGVLMREVSVLYQAFSEGRPSPLPELEIQYPDYSVWQRDWLRGEVLDQQVNYWREQLSGVAPLELPLDRPRPAMMTFRGAAEAVTVPAETTEKLRKLGQRHGATLYMTLLAAFQVLLSRYSGQQDISVGSPIAGRQRPELEPLIGFFINTLVLRSRLSDESSFTQLLNQVRETTLQAYAHQDVPFEKLVEVIHPERNLDRTPLFQAMFILQNTPQSGLQFGSAKLLPFNIGGSTVKFDLTFSLSEFDSGLAGSLGYSTDLFEASSIQRMIGHYCMLLESIAADAEQKLSDLQFLPEAEKQLLLTEWNNTAVPLPFGEGKYLLDLIEEQAEQKPKAEAVVYGTESLTYRELNRRANQLARHLKKLGVGPEVRVGICVERSLKMIVGLLGIMKAGGVYVPLDPEYPPERVRYMLEDSQASVLLTEQKLLSQLPPYSGRVISLDEQWPEIERESGDNLPRVTFGDNLAYLIYTSGSTGRPKGVAIRHSSAAILVAWTRHVYSDEELHGVLASTSICFDVSIFEIFMTLSCGGRMLLVGNALDLAEMTNPDQVKVVTTVPSAMRELARMRAIPDSVRAIGLGGEAVPAALAPELYEASKAERVLNLYGPSEDTTYTTCALLTRTQEPLRVAVGRPVPNTQLYVLDAAMKPVPLGIPGELYIGGSGLARGYWNHPELTAERFVPNPLSQQGGERLYRTGDLVRYRADGNLEFLSRLDHQVKIRGHRIELGEIEAVLEEQPSIRQAIVLAREDEPGEKRLVAYVVAEAEATVSADELQAVLKQRVPEYMVPGVFVMLSEMPLTPNGKINRKALPTPEKGRAAARAAYIAPRTADEEALAQIWCEALGLERVGVEDNFFDLGGHSLLAVRLRAMLRNRLNYNVTLVDLFQNSTIAGMAKRMGHATEHPQHQVLVPIQPQGTESPFFCVHPIGGQVFCYNLLSRELGSDRPFYGLQATAAESAQTIEEMASIYIREIRQVQEHGPYFLSGWSMGGLIAFEMARQLKAAGESIALLALFDTYPPSRNRLPGYDGASQLPVLIRFALEMARSLASDITALQARFAQLSSEEQRKLVLEELITAEVLPRENAETEFAHMLDIYTRNLHAMETYAPAPQEQSIVLFKASERDNPEEIASEWKSIAKQGVELHVIQGNHYTILQRPNVATLASGLQKYLSQNLR